MDSGAENQDPGNPSTRSPEDQHPLQNNSFEGKCSDVEEKPLEDKTSSRLRENGSQRRKAESCSNQETYRKKESSSRDSPYCGGGTSLGEKCGVTLEKRGKVRGVGHSSNGKEPGLGEPRRAQRRRTEHSKRPRSRSSRVRLPLLRKSLVISLRAMSEAIYQNIVQVRNHTVPACLSWEQYALFAELRRYLRTQVQTTYAMATQAAYVFPAEGWLIPAPLPGPQDPAAEGREAQGPS